MEKTAFRTALKTASILVGGIFWGAILLTCAFLIPLDNSSPNVKTSKEILDTEGWYPSLPLAKAFEGEILSVNPGGMLDNFTDDIMISQASMQMDGNPLFYALNTDGYSYYWHGYITVLRPLLCFFHYGQIRVLNQLAQLLLILVMACMLYQKKGLRWALFALTVYAMLMPQAVACSLQYSWVFYIGVIGSVLVIRYRTELKKTHACYLFLVLGMLTSYFDLLTYPLFTWGMPMLWWVIMEEEARREIDSLKDIIACGLVWILGYGGMWAGKWVLGQIVLHEAVVLRAWNEVLYRSGPTDTGIGSSRFTSVIRNWEGMSGIQLIIPLALWFLWFVYRLAKKKGNARPVKPFCLALIAFSPICWYMVLFNHTFVHVNFTYRIFSITFSSLLAAMILSVETQDSETHRSPLARILPACVLLLAALTTLLSKEEFFVHNGHVPPQAVLLSEGLQISQVLVPEYSRIEKINVGLQAEGRLIGNFLVTVSKDGAPCFETTISAQAAASQNFYEIPLHLKAAPGAEYLLTIRTDSFIDTEGYALTTGDDSRPLEAFSCLFYDQDSMEGQLTGGICYLRLPDKFRLLYIFLTQAGVYWAVYLMVQKISRLHPHTG